MGRRRRSRLAVRGCRVRPTRRRRLTLLECQVADESGPLKAVWFNQEYLADQLDGGDRGAASRQARDGLAAARRSGCRARAGQAPRRQTITAGTRRAWFPSIRRPRAFRPGGSASLAWQARGCSATRPSSCRRSFAYRRAPPSARMRSRRRICRARCRECRSARRRLAFEELYLFQLALVSRRRSREVARDAERLRLAGPLVERWLGLARVRAHRRSARGAPDIDARLGERAADAAPARWARSGRVRPSSRSTRCCAPPRPGMQAALMAPTETLAEQHFATMERLVPADLFADAEATRLGPPDRAADGLDPGARASRAARAARHRRAAAAGRDPRADRGGRSSSSAWRLPSSTSSTGSACSQRAALDDKSARRACPTHPASDGDADPAHARADAVRRPRTPRASRAPCRPPPGEDLGRPGGEARGRLRLHSRLGCAEGRQCFVVCPLVEESEQLQARAATREGERLAGGEFRDFAVEVMHGQMPAARSAR